MQSARDLVGILVEFPPGVELGHDDLGGGDAFILVDVGGDAAAVVAHGARAVRIERHHDLGGEARKGFVDGVVDHLVDHVVEAGAVVGVADIHARPFAHGIEALEDLDRFGAIFVGGGKVAGGFSHRRVSSRWVKLRFRVGRRGLVWHENPAPYRPRRMPIIC